MGYSTDMSIELPIEHLFVGYIVKYFIAKHTLCHSGIVIGFQFAVELDSFAIAAKVESIKTLLFRKHYSNSL